MNTAELQLVPETLLKKRHDLDALKAKRAAAAILNPRVSRKRVTDKSKIVKIIKPETILVRSRSRKNAGTRFRRVLKNGMQKRASDKVVIKKKYWDSVKEEELEETAMLRQVEQGNVDNSTDTDMVEADKKEKSPKMSHEKHTYHGQCHVIPYKANSIGATTIFAILIRPILRSVPEPVRKTLFMLRLRRVNEGVFLTYTPQTRKLLHLVEPYVLYGIPSAETISDLVRRRGFCRLEGKRVPLSDNTVIEKNLGDIGLICVEDVIQVLSSPNLDAIQSEEHETLSKVMKFLWPFRLSARKSKFQEKILDFKDGKLYGDQGEAMNGYIREML